MAKRSRRKNQQIKPATMVEIYSPEKKVPLPSSLEELPLTYQALIDYVEKLGEFKPFNLRQETYLRIERITGTPLICYVAKTENVPPGVPAYIDDSDLIGFDDLTRTTEGKSLDIFIISNGGTAEATERIVKLLRERFERIRFLVPANAYSAATLLCLSGDEVVMAAPGTLGPIDPQVNGIPARAILRAFEHVKEQLKAEGPGALTAYMPLLSKYDLHILEICKSAEELSVELAKTWLSQYMLKCDREDPRVQEIVDYLASYDLHKSHARGIDRAKARELGLNVIYVEEIDGLGDLLRSLRNQYALWFDRTPFFKMFDNARGINWGRQAQQITIQMPPRRDRPTQQPGTPKRSS